MRFKFSFFSILTIGFLFSEVLLAQNFEGRLSYSSYSIEKGDTIESSFMNYWVKDYLYKHSGYVPKAPLMDLGTLYADADQMERKNIDNSGKVERVPTTVSWTVPTFKPVQTDQTLEILGFNCVKIDLINSKTNEAVSSIWVTNEIKNEYFDQFVELFDHQNTLFPCKGIDGWILKREDYRREGEVFVSEAKEIEEMNLSIAEMALY